MFRTVWSKTLRQYRVPALCWGCGLAFFLLASLAGYATQVPDAAARASIAQLVQSLRFFGEPVAATTPEGYVTWRIMGMALPVLLSIWTLLAGARLLRGEEERGSMDLLLATPYSRVRLALEKLGALVIALIFIGVLIGVGAIAGEAGAKITVNAGRALLAGLNISLIALFFASLALLLSQFLRNPGAAASWTGGLLALSVLLDGTGRALDNGEWLRRFSPLYYYNANKPLIITYTGKPWSPLVLLALIIIFVLVSVLLFRMRDIGMGALSGWTQQGARKQQTPEQLLARAEHALPNRAIGLQALRAQAVPAFWWLLGLVAYVACTTLVTPAMLKPLQQVTGGSPLLKNMFSGHDIGTNAGFLSFIVFDLASVLVVVFAFNQALHWSSDLERGRMELVFATPRSRVRILLERFAAVLLMVLAAPLLIWLTVMLCAHTVDLSVDGTKVAIAALSILPLELVVAAFVYALAARVHTGIITAIISAYLAIAFVIIEMLQSLLKWPRWTMSLSIFYDYGSPIRDGWNWGALLGMLGVSALLLLIAVVQFRQSDIERGI